MDKNELDLVRKLLTCFTKVTLKDLQGKSRQQHIVDARHHISYFLRIKKEMSFGKIGKIMRKDHSTIMGGVTKVAGYLDVYQRSRSIIAEMECVSGLGKLNPESYTYGNTQGWEVSATC